MLMSAVQGILSLNTGPPPAIPIVEDWTETIQATTGVSITATAPAGITSGDMLVLIVCTDTVNKATHTFAALTDWTLVGGESSNAVDAMIGVYVKAATGSEGSVSPSWEGTTAGSIAYYLRISGADTAAVDASGFNKANGLASHIIPSITTTVDNCLAIYGLSFDGGDGYTFSVSGEDWVQKDQGQTIASGAGSSACFGTRIVPSAGASGNAVVACSGTDGASYFQLALAPA